jgi:hypothetical protein
MRESFAVVLDFLHQFWTLGTVRGMVEEDSGAVWTHVLQV